MGLGGQRLVRQEITATLNGQKLFEKPVIDALIRLASDLFEGKEATIHGSSLTS